MYADVAERYPQGTAEVELRGGFAVLDAEAAEGIVAMLVAHDADPADDTPRAVGCAGLRSVTTPDPVHVEEVRKVFVRPAVRRRGAATAMLGALEVAAAGRGVQRLVLETGRRQPEALAVYRRLGYEEIEPWDGIEADQGSIHLGKDLCPREAVSTPAPRGGSIGAVEPEEGPCRPSC